MTVIRSKRGHPFKVKSLKTLKRLKKINAFNLVHLLVKKSAEDANFFNENFQIKGWSTVTS